MSVRQIVLGDGTKRWEVRTDVGEPDGTRRQVRRRYRTEREAKQADAKTVTQVAEGTFVARDERTVRTFLTEWVDGRVDLLSTTRHHYRSNLRPIIATYGDLQLQRLAKRHVDAWVREMTGKGRSPRTVNLTLTVLSAALDAAVKGRLIARNPVLLVSRPRPETRVEGQAWTAAQCATFLTQASQQRESALWRLTMMGLRRGEVLGLRWSDVDLDKGLIHVRQARVLEGGVVVVNPPKTKAGIRSLPIPAEVVEDLKALRTKQVAERLAHGSYRDPELVAVDTIGRGLRPEWYSDEFHRISAAAELPRIRLHDARHSAASLMAALGIPASIAAECLGHDPVVYMRTYVHNYADDRRVAMETLADAVR